MGSFCYSHDTHPLGSNSHGCLTLHFAKNSNERRAKLLKPTLPNAEYRMKKLFVLMAVSFLVLFVCAGHCCAEVTKFSRNKALWEAMSPEERLRIAENYRRLKAQPEATQEQTRRNYQNYHGLSIEEKYYLRERYRAYHGLSPSYRERVNERIRRVDSLTPEDRVRLMRRYHRIKERPVAERMKYLEQSLFWKGLNEQEKEIFKRLMFPD
jgi:hypothetical protein